MRKLRILTAVAAFLAVFRLVTGPASAVTDCTFTISGTTMSLDADCTTDATVPIPDGFTLDGQGHSITAVRPNAGHFHGGVVGNSGEVAHVTRLVVQTINLSNACDGGADSLIGISFFGASGSITHNTIQNINQGPSGCQEGNAIDVRNRDDFPPSIPGSVTVEISHNVIEDYQKTGILCLGRADCSIRFNFVGESFTQQNLAANSIQLGPGSTGVVEFNHIAGNQWLGASNWGASAMLLFFSDSAIVRRNNIGGNSDVGIYVLGPDNVVDNNRVFDGGSSLHGDWGIIDYEISSVITNNKIRGFTYPTYPVLDGQVLIPAPHPVEVCFGADCSN